MQILRVLWTSALLATSGLANTTNPPADQVSLVSTNIVVPPETAGETAQFVVKYLTDMHVTRRPFDDIIADRALDIYLNSLDPDHSYFLESDLTNALHQRLNLDDLVKSGDVQLAYDLFATFKRRVHERTTFVTNLLTIPIDVDVDEYYSWNRKDEPHVVDETEWDELWRKKIKNEYVGSRVSRKIREDERAAKAAKAELEKANATNLTDSVTNALPDEITTTGTNAVDEGTSNEPEEEKTIEENIIGRYQRFSKSVEDIETQWVLDQYLTAFCRAFDPHCDYMSPAAAEEFNIAISLSLVGIGAVLKLSGGAVEIVEVMPGGPADRDDRPVKLEAGDRIIAVGQGDEPLIDVRNWSLNKIVRIIRGEKDTIVKLTVIPVDAPTDDETKLVDLVRDEIKLEDRGAKKKIYDSHGHDGVKRKLGVISLPAFYGDIRNANDNIQGKSCAKDVERLLLELRDEAVDGVVLNLRNNGGGSLREAGFMTGLFIPEGPVVIIKDGSGASILPDTNPTITYAGPLIILINRHTASAGEILAGALQDYGRAVVVGDSRTHGKGTVQTVRPLGEKGELGSIKITNAQFYRITGSSTQLKGVTSDILVPSPYDYTRTGEERLDYALQWSMSKRSRFRPFGVLTAAVRELERLSTERLSASPRFSTYTNLLTQFEAINLQETLPLQFEKRLERARTRAKLKTLQDDFPELEDDVKNDLVLSEALHVLSDLVTLTPGSAWPGYTPKPKAEADVALDVLDATLRKELLQWIEAVDLSDDANQDALREQLQAIQSLIDQLRDAGEAGDMEAIHVLEERLKAIK
ncbi:MAG: carboxy terminal-processing peptidase [Kiritimatiellae bacterium]|nr:carboxy terminal-processing peptidase [Kiritimatiellia bacterium]